MSSCREMQHCRERGKRGVREYHRTDRGPSSQHTLSLLVPRRVETIVVSAICPVCNSYHAGKIESTRHSRCRIAVGANAVLSLRDGSAFISHRSSGTRQEQDNINAKNVVDPLFLLLLVVDSLGGTYDSCRVSRTCAVLLVQSSCGRCELLGMSK